MHLDEERLQRLVHGELTTPDEADARGHVASCEECALRLALAEREEREVEALLARVDEPAPWVSADAVMRRARMEEATPSERGPRPAHARRWAVMLSAAVLLGSTAVLAMRASSLREWMNHTLVGAGAGTRTRSLPQPIDSRAGGIAVEPGDRLTIVFSTPQDQGGVRVSLSDGAEVEIQGPPGAASFTSEAQRLVVDNRGAAVFEIRVPRSAPWIEIQVASSRVFLKDGSRTTPAVDPSEIRPLKPASP